MWKIGIRVIVAMAVAFVVARGIMACQHLDTYQITAENVKTAYKCLVQIRGLTAQVQEQVPACMQLAEAIKTEGPATE